MNAHVSYLVGLAMGYIQKGNLDDAERLLKQALKMAPKNSEIFRLLGVNFAFKKNLQEALTTIDRSIKLAPDNWLSHSNRGNILKDLNRLNDALKSYDRAITLRPDYAEAHNNRGNVLYDLGQFDQSIESYNRAIFLQPNYADAFHGKGNALKRLGNPEEALKSYELAIKSDPTAGYMLSSVITIKMQLCQWSGIGEQIEKLYELGLQSTKKIHPFHLLSICEDPNLLLVLTQQFMHDNYPPISDLGSIKKDLPHNKIRIGYFSPDLRNHAVSFLIAGMIEAHDKSKFEMFAFSMGRYKDDEMRERLRPNFKEFIDISEKSDIEVVQLSRDLGIDIAVDLGGLTQDARPGIFSYRAAPTQIGYLGYLGTMGVSYMDYIIADRIIIPDELQSFYKEKILYLPSYQANDPKRRIADKIFTREDLGLPSSGFVYCCFNNNLKITPSILDSWAFIINSVDNSVIFLHAENPSIKKNLIAEFLLRGIQQERVIFAERLPRDEYLARYRLADLFLDTSPYNAGTTASDALWAGLPLLTFVGKTFSSRMGASLLTAIGLPELIAASQQEYESIAIELGRNPSRLQEIKNKLVEVRSTALLFDNEVFTHSLESAYEKVYSRHRSGYSPEHIG